MNAANQTLEFDPPGNLTFDSIKFTAMTAADGQFAVDNAEGLYTSSDGAKFTLTEASFDYGVVFMDQDLAFDVAIVDGDGDVSSSTVLNIHIEADATTEDGGFVLTGSDASDVIVGGDSNDELVGGEGDDILIGGAGDDVLTGDLGADTFVWRLGDQSVTPGDPAEDTVTDFTTGQNDVLDLSDLLQGADQGSLASYLHFEQDGDNTVVHISTAGEFDGSNHATVADQVILLENFSMEGADSAAVIQQLIDSNNLIISNG